MELHRKSHLTTSELAALVGVKDGTIRRGYCVNGHYLGLVPVKLPNNRLLWPTEEYKKMIYEAAERS